MGKISELINQMIQRMLESSEWTSANPTHINTFIQANAIDNPDFEAEIESMMKENTKTTSSDSSDTETAINDDVKKNVDSTKLKVDNMMSGNMGDIQKMSTEQFGNIRSVATNPFGFFTKTLLRKLRTGAGILFVVAIAIEVAKFLIEEMYKPGRAFDMRFREQIDKQIIQFTTRKEQEELRSGYRSLITTTIGGLRGNSLRGQIGGNFYSSPFTSRDSNIYDPSYVRFPSREIRDMRKVHTGAGGISSPHASPRGQG